jgi:hypothetical protein
MPGHANAHTNKNTNPCLEPMYDGCVTLTPILHPLGVSDQTVGVVLFCFTFFVVCFLLLGGMLGCVINTWGVQQDFRTDFDDLDLTTENIDFDEVGDDLEKFQQDEILRKVLSEVRGLLGTGT